MVGTEVIQIPISIADLPTLIPELYRKETVPYEAIKDKGDVLGGFIEVGELNVYDPTKIKRFVERDLQKKLGKQYPKMIKENGISIVLDNGLIIIQIEPVKGQKNNLFEYLSSTHSPLYTHIMSFPYKTVAEKQNEQVSVVTSVSEEIEVEEPPAILKEIEPTSSVSLDPEETKKKLEQVDKIKELYERLSPVST